MKKEDFYNILGVTKGASDNEIKKKYYLLAKEFHPDKNDETGAEEKFKEIKLAYEAIKDADSRREYDLHRRAEEMEERASRHAASCAAERFGFNRGPSSFSGSFAFNAEDMQDVFRSAFRGKNKENAGPTKSNAKNTTYRNTYDFTTKPEWENDWAFGGGGGDPIFSFKFGFEEPTRNSHNNPDNIFDRFFEDPFFMDSFPFGVDPGIPRSHEPKNNSTHFRPPGKSAAEKAAEERERKAAEEKAREEKLRKDAQRKAKAAAEKREREFRDEQLRKKGRVYDWQKTSKDEETTENKDMQKLSCNYCSAKFHPAQLTIHEKECREAYYGTTGSNASDSSNEEAFSETYKPRQEDFKTNDAYIPKAEAAASSTYPSGGESPSSSTYIPKTEYFTSSPTTDRKPAGSTIKNDILREAYLGAINETLHQHARGNPVPEEPKTQEFFACEHCGGSFSEAVAKYHIPFCGRKHGVKSDSNNNASSSSSRSAPKPSQAKPSQSSNFTSEASRPKLYKATARPSPSTTRSAYDRVASPSFTNLGSARPRATASSTDYMDEPYTPSYTPRVQTNYNMGRPIGSSTRIRYVPSTSRSHAPPIVRISMAGASPTLLTFRMGRT